MGNIKKEKKTAAGRCRAEPGSDRMVDEDIKMKRQLAGWNMAAVIAPTAGNNLKCQGRLHYKVVPLVPVFSFHVCCYVCVYTFLSRTFFFFFHFFFIFTPFSCRPLARSYRCVNA
jgi:hypothetical protein